MRERAGRPPRLADDFASAVPFSLMAALQGGAELEFRTLRRILQAEQSPLSGAIMMLENEGHVAVRRPSFGETGTWVSATAEGRAAFAAHLAALGVIAGDGSRRR